MGDFRLEFANYLNKNCPEEFNQLTSSPSLPYDYLQTVSTMEMKSEIELDKNPEKTYRFKLQAKMFEFNQYCNQGPLKKEDILDLMLSGQKMKPTQQFRRQDSVKCEEIPIRKQVALNVQQLPQQVIPQFPMQQLSHRK